MLLWRVGYSCTRWDTLSCYPLTFNDNRPSEWSTSQSTVTLRLVTTHTPLHTHTHAHTIDRTQLLIARGSTGRLSAPPCCAAARGSAPGSPPPPSSSLPIYQHFPALLRATIVASKVPLPALPALPCHPRERRAGRLHRHNQTKTIKRELHAEQQLTSH